jgi:uncharacterized oligopeptide transporter (OPT) family protein
MHGEVMIPILICLGFFAMVFGIVYMNKRENLAMIEKGMNPKQYRPVPYKNLKWGLLLVGAGIGLLLAFLMDHFMLNPRDREDIDGTVTFVYFAMIAIGGGIGLIYSYRIEKRELLDNKTPE